MCCKAVPAPKVIPYALTQPFVNELHRRGCAVQVVSLYEKEINPVLLAAIVKKITDFGCIYDDDLVPLFDDVLKSDLLVLATPIYSWYCTLL